MRELRAGDDEVLDRLPAGVVVGVVERGRGSELAQQLLVPRDPLVELQEALLEARRADVDDVGVAEPLDHGADVVADPRERLVERRQIGDARPLVEALAHLLADAFEQSSSGATIVNMMTLDMLIGSGGVLSHAPRRQQSGLMMIDAFLPEGITRLAVDSIFMMPQLGVLTEVQPKAATEVFEKVPAAVRRVGGYLMVDYKKVAEAYA